MTDQDLDDYMNSIESIVPIEPKIEPKQIDLVQFYYDNGEFYYSIGKQDEGDRCFRLAREEFKKNV